METRLIMLPNPILVSDAPSMMGMKCYDTSDFTVFEKKYDCKFHEFTNERPVNEWNYKPIVAGLPDLPKLDLSLIAEEIGWVDVEKLAKEKFPDESTAGWIDSFSPRERRGFMEGFKASQYINEKKYSDEDLFNLLKMVHDKRLDSLSARIVDNGRVTDFNFWNSYSKKQVYASELISEFIQSLPKEYLVQVEMEVNQCDGCISGHHIIDGIHKAPYPSGSMVCKKHLYDRPKITNNTIKVTKIIK